MMDKEQSENKLNKISSGYIRHNLKEDNVGRMCKFKGRHSDTDNPFADISDKR
jgi:hypothetical protein